MTEPVRISGADVAPEQQAVRYELAFLAFQLLDGPKAVEGVLPWVEGHGELLGCWQTENGPLGRLVVLRGFENQQALDEERLRARHSRKPFGGDHLTDLSLQSYAPFPFVPPVRPGKYGSVYEIRDYHLRPGGLTATIDGWREALPARHLVDPLTVVMYALDGPDRIIQIWPFASLDERLAIRGDLYAKGMWPPPGAPEEILDANSIIALPTEFSPLA